MRLTNEPFEHVAFFTDLIGEDLYAELRRAALAGAKVDWSEVAAELSVAAKRLGVA